MNDIPAMRVEVDLWPFNWTWFPEVWSLYWGHLRMRWLGMAVTVLAR